jgi:Flp pilus assembly protein TadD
MTDAPAAPAATDREAARPRTAAVVAVLAGLLLLWLPSVFLGFVKWDDPLFCTTNRDVAHPDLLHIFDPTNWVAGDWTPLATVTYAAERALFGDAPWAPHATNVLLHVLSVWLVVRLLREIGFGPWESLGVALLFGVHPLQVESVTWVSARKNVLVAVFAVSFLRSFVAGRPGRATVWLVLALCSKATSVGLPLVAAATHVLGIGAARPRSTWAWIAGWLALSAGRAAISLSAQAAPLAAIAELGFAGRMAYMGSVLTTQAAQVVAPAGLSILYEPPRRAWTDPVLLAQWAGIAALAAACVVAARRDRRLALVGVFALAMMAPTLNVFPAPCLQADRYAHLPLVGISAFLVAALRPLARVRPWAPAAIVGGWVALVAVPTTLARQAVWKSTEALFNDACLKTPANGVVWANLGAEFLDQGRRDEARLALEKALTLPHPEPQAILTNLAVLDHDAGDLAGAEALARRAIALAPDEGQAQALLGRILCETNRVAEAGEHLDAAARLEPDWTRTWLYRAEWHVRADRLDDARADVERARAIPGGRTIVASVAAAIDVLSGHMPEALATLRESAPPGTSDEALRAALAQKLRFLGRDAAAGAASR